MEERSVQFFDRINASIHLPSLPHILLKLIELCHDEKSTVKDLSQIIHTDAALSAKVMAAANSVFYGRSQTVIHVEQALTILGLNAIRNIVLSASDIQAFSPLKENCVLELKVFWKHSLMCALLSKGIAEKLTYPSPEEAFLTGLLHDIGKLVLRENFPKKYAGGLTPSKDSQELISDQTPHLRFSHSSVGAWLIKRWNLQSFMSDAVLYHHESLDRIQDALPLVKIIYAANALCPETKVETAIKLNIATNILGLETSEIEDLAFQAGKELDKTARALGIDIERSDGSGALISETDLKIQDDLVRQVKDIVSLQGTLHNLLEARDVEAVLKIVQQGIEIIFDIKDVLFFLYDPQKNILLGKSVSSNRAHDVINEVSIPFKKGKNLLVHSLLNGCPLDSFSDSITDNLSIMDEQIIGLIGSEGILCLPMTAYQRHMGVIVLGLKKVRAAGLAEKKRLLMMFAKQASLALYAKDASQNHIDDGQSEHLDSLPILARKVAHEVNTPLSIIKNYIAVLRNKLPENQSFREEIRIINEEIDRVALLVHELSDATKLKDRLSEPLDLNALISNLIKIFQETFILKPNINAHLNLDASLPMVMADKNHVKQILSNLIINSVEAMPGGGNINIHTRYASNNTGTAPSPPTDSKPGHIEITIKDDGPGIAEAVKPRLFEPNITSKGAGHSGLGLSIVYNKVKGLKGDITCESDAEKGTQFKIVFPIAHHQSS